MFCCVETSSLRDLTSYEPHNVRIFLPFPASIIGKSRSLATPCTILLSSVWPQNDVWCASVPTWLISIKPIHSPSQFQNSFSVLQNMSNRSKWSAQSLGNGYGSRALATSPLKNISLSLAIWNRSRAREIQRKHVEIDLVNLGLIIYYPWCTHIFLCVLKSGKQFWESTATFFLTNIEQLRVYAVSSRRCIERRCLLVTH